MRTYLLGGFVERTPYLLPDQKNLPIKNHFTFFCLGSVSETERLLPPAIAKNSAFYHSAKQFSREKQPSEVQIVTDRCTPARLAVSALRLIERELTDVLRGHFDDSRLDQVVCKDERSFLQGIQ